MLFDKSKKIQSTAKDTAPAKTLSSGPTPPKNEAPDPEAPKRGRGRPRNESAIEAAEAPKRGRGRPRKEPAPELDATPKRGPGRPRKDPTVSETDAPKRGRGRPRKEVATSDLVDSPKRFRPKAETPSHFNLISNVSGEKLPEVTLRPRKPLAGKVVKTKPVSEAPSIDRLIKIELRAGEAVPIPTFRARGASNEKPARPQQPKREPRQSQEPRSEKHAIPEPVAAPEPPKREFIRIPAEAPQIVLRHGVPTLVRDHRVFPPIFFFGNASDEKRLDVVLEEIKYAAEAGINVIVHYVDLVVNEDGNADDAVQFASYMLQRTLEVAPDAQVVFRTVFSAANGWENTYRKAKYVAESGGLGDPSVCDDQYWGDAEKCLSDFVSKLRAAPKAEHVMGVHLERGEWFFAAGWGYDTSPAAQDAFRDWARMRYRNDNVALCASWFDGQVQFETLTVPDYSGEIKAGEEFVRTGRKTRRWVDYHLFLSDVTVERIGKLAHIAKKASDGNFLVGISYGYTFEWSHPASGHLSLGKLLRNPEVDFIAGPPSYRNREPGGTCPFPGPIDSFALNGKLYVSEEDFKTPITAKFEPDDFNPVMKTPQSLETVHWRGLGAAVAHGGGVCWMDLWGNGWLKSPGIWERASQVRDALINRMAVPLGDPDIAVFIDERSLAYLVDQRAFALLVQNVRESVLRSGLSAGFYLLSDLAHREQFPEAKVYVFLNAWDIRPEVRSAIKARLQRDNKVLFWMYAAGLFDTGRDALERVREVTGIALKRQPFAAKSGTAIVHRKHPLCEALPENVLSHGGELEPSYFAIPEESVVLGEYTATGLPSFVLRENHDDPKQKWTSVFLGEPVVTPALFRALGQMAGAHVWSFQEDLVHVRSPFLTLHASGAGTRSITLPEKLSAYNLQRKEWNGTEGGQLKLNVSDGQTQTFLVGSKSEVEEILATPVADLLRVEEIPDRTENTLHLDELHFDVPIMKVDTWVEEGWSEEMATDLVFKPSEMEEAIAVEETAEEATYERRAQHQGRRRGRRNGRKRNEQSDFDVAEMNIVFRKRE